MTQASVSEHESERPGTYKLDRNLLVVQQIGALKDDTKGTLANFLANAVVNTDDIGGGRTHVDHGCCVVSCRVVSRIDGGCSRSLASQNQLTTHGTETEIEI